MTPALSPSRAADFKQCPLLFRFRTIDKLEGPPSPAAARGTLVHAVLEHLFDLPADQRTPEAAVALLEPRWSALVQERPELEAMIDDDELLTTESWFAAAQTLVEQWFELEDPTRLEPAARELYVETEVEGLTLRGYVDRLDVAPDGAMRVVDYKTGRSPSELFEAKALFQMKFYALVLWRIHGEIPRQLQLVYLGNGEVVRYAPDERDLLAIERNVKAPRRPATGARAPRGCATGATSATCARRGAAPLPRCPTEPATSRSTRPAQELSTPPRSETEAASSASRCGVMPASPSTCTAPGISGTATTCGTASVGTPAATAERTPVGESSMATQSPGATPSRRAAAR
jgi:putative RecB family exonuclease